MPLVRRSCRRSNGYLVSHAPRQDQLRVGERVRLVALLLPGDQRAAMWRSMALLEDAAAPGWKTTTYRRDDDVGSFSRSIVSGQASRSVDIRLGSRRWRGTTSPWVFALMYTPALPSTVADMLAIWMPQGQWLNCVGCPDRTPVFESMTSTRGSSILSGPMHEAYGIGQSGSIVSDSMP